VIVDSSAIVAILLKEPGYERLLDRGKTLLARFLQEAEIEVVEFAADHWTAAADAYLAYGKGRHRAGLNGDCMTYAVAKLAGEPLLCLGDDFPATDLALV
jgi:ribonuclease VapC